jgi:hypothetical protein
MSADAADALLHSRKRSLRNGSIAGTALAAVVLIATILYAVANGWKLYAGFILAVGYFWYRVGSSWFETRPRLVLLLRRFRKRSKKEFVLAHQLGLACRALAVPITVQDSSFRGDLPIGLQVLTVILEIASILGPPYVISLIALYYPGSAAIGWQAVALLWLVGGGSVYLCFKYLFRRTAVFRASKTNWRHTMQNVVRNIRRRPWTYAGTRVLKLPDERWKDAIQYFLNEADAVVIDISEISANVEWEIQETFARIRPEAILLCWASDKASGADLSSPAMERLTEFIPAESVQRCSRHAYSRSTSRLDSDGTDSLTKPVALCLASGSRKPTLVGRRWGRGMLLVSKFAVSLTLTIAGCMLVSKIREIGAADHGLLRRNVLSASVRIANGYSGDQRAFWERLRAQLNHLHGVTSAALSDILPLDDSSKTDLVREGTNPSRVMNASIFHVSPDYFHTIDVSILRGRVFTNRDKGNSPRVAVISETLAVLQWPREDPILGKIKIGSSSASWDIVGIVRDVKRRQGLELQALCAVYVPYVQDDSVSHMYVLIRTPSDPIGVAQSLVSTLHALDGNARSEQIRSLQDIYRFQ